MFSLPSYQELSKEQDAIYNLPLSGTHLIVGPPGTGKTVLAIYRADMFKKAGKKTRFIVYNRTLEQYLQHATREVKIGSETTTYNSWFWNWYRKALGRRVPQVRRYCYDWDKVFLELTQEGDRVWQYKLDHLVLDEAQDLPKQAFPALAMVAENLTVFADENQRIHDYNSTIEEIREVLGLDNVKQIRKNYRNSRPIAEFAREFYVGLPTGIPELPDRKGIKPRVMHTGASIERDAEVVVRYAVDRRRQDVGVLFPYNDQQVQFMRAVQQDLRNKGISLNVQMYLSTNCDYGKIDFSQPGIKVINYQSAKGLEFDAVFLPQVDRFRENPRSDGVKMKFYMLTSRAREWLCIMHTDTQLPEILEHVPEHLYDRLPRK